LSERGLKGSTHDFQLPRRIAVRPKPDEPS
jgi:hypothetical protein